MRNDLHVLLRLLLKYRDDNRLNVTAADLVVNIVSTFDVLGI